MDAIVRSTFLAILLIAPIPVIGVLFAAYSNLGTLGSVIYLGTKVWILIFPFICWIWFQKNKIEFQAPNLPSIKDGILTGLIFTLIIIGSYFVLAHGKIDFTDMKKVLLDGGISSLKIYIYLAITLTILNSLFEEYIFRWFIFEQLSTKLKRNLAIFICSFIFMIHHTVVLYAYIPWYFNLLVSLSILFAGVVWSYLYHKHNSIIPGYISHICADIAVFVIGYFALYSS